MMGTTQDYFIKRDRYKTITDGQLLQWQIYVPAENRMYTKMTNSEAAQWSDESTWYAYVSHAHAVPLKMIIDNGQFTMTATATEIKIVKLGDSVFELPAGTKTEKSPY